MKKANVILFPMPDVTLNEKDYKSFMRYLQNMEDATNWRVFFYYRKQATQLLQRVEEGNGT